MSDILELLRDFQGIIGVLAGMFGMQLMRNMGETYIEFNNGLFQYIGLERDGEGGFIEREIKNSYEGPKTCKYSMEVEVYNRSETPRVLRKIQIEFYRNNKLIGKTAPKNESTRQSFAGGTKIDEIGVINVHAKEVVRVSVCGNINLDTIYDKVYFTAVQNKCKKIRKLIEIV